MTCLSSHSPGELRARSVRVVLAGAVCAASVLLALVWADRARAQVCADTDCLPPAGSAYTGASAVNYSWFGQPIVLTGVLHDSLTACDPPPGSLGTTVHTFYSMLRGVITVGANPGLPFSAPAHVTVKVTSTGTLGTTRYFDTELLQLDTGGGSLPAGVMIRESPTLASFGKTDITPGTGGFVIDSFFDVFTELSLDGGQQWVPSLGTSERMTATSPACPDPVRRSSWGAVKDLYR